MTKEIHTQIKISASPEKVWTILTNFDTYPEWNPFIKSLNGKVEAGNKISVTLQPPHQKAMTFKPKVLVSKKNKAFTWLGHLGLPGIFDGQHHFELIDNNDGTTTFIQSEKFKGILVSLLNLENTEKGFVLMNQKLKHLAEQKSS